MTVPTFEKLKTAIASAAAEGAAEAALVFTQKLEATGESATMSRAPDGSALVFVDNALSREFGTRRNPAQAFLGPALQANRAAIIALIGQKVGAAMRGRS